MALALPLLLPLPLLVVVLLLVLLLVVLVLLVQLLVLLVLLLLLLLLLLQLLVQLVVLVIMMMVMLLPLLLCHRTYRSLYSSCGAVQERNDADFSEMMQRQRRRRKCPSWSLLLIEVFGRYQALVLRRWDCLVDEFL